MPIKIQNCDNSIQNWEMLQHFPKERAKKVFKSNFYTQQMYE